MVLLDRDGRVLAALARLHGPGARRPRRRSGRRSRWSRPASPWALGNLLPYGSTGVINFALALPTPSGHADPGDRASTPPRSAAFTDRELEQIPGVKGAHHYLLDGNGVVIASTNPAGPPAITFTRRRSSTC